MNDRSLLSRTIAGVLGRDLRNRAGIELYVGAGACLTLVTEALERKDTKLLGRLMSLRMSANPSIVKGRLDQG